VFLGLRSLAPVLVQDAKLQVRLGVLGVEGEDRAVSLLGPCLVP
jgi:hypothetical protein